MAYIGRQLARGENKLFDDISSSFNGSTTTFNLTVSSVATATATAYQLFVSLGGVMQKPNTDFTTAGNQITFTTAPAAGLSCWIMMQGDTIDQAAIPDASVTPSKIAGSGDFAFPADIRLKDADGSHYVGFQAPTTVTTNKVWTLPATDGSASQYLQTNGSGVLTWASVTIGGASGIDFNDNVKARWGTGNDLEIFHNSSNSVINDAGTGDLLLQVGGSTKATVSSTGLAVTGALTVSTNATITGDLTVSGTTTTINTQTLDVEDKNVVIGKVSSPSDTTADGGGWTLKGATDKTFNWVNATDAWTSSEHIHLIDNKKLFVGGASGTTDGLEIVHNGSNSILNDAGTGTLQFQLGGSTKLEVQSGGINVTGAINVDGSPLSTAPEVTMTASGAIAANKPVMVNSNGTVSEVALQAAGFESPQVINTLNPTFVRMAYTPDQDKVLLVYIRSSYAYMRLGTITAGTVTWGSDVTVDGNTATEVAMCYDTWQDKFAIVLVQGGSPYIKMATVSGSSVSISSRDRVSNSTGCDQLEVTEAPAANRIVVFYRDSNSSYNLRCRIGQSFSGGVYTNWSSTQTVGTGTCLNPTGFYDSWSNRGVIAWTDYDGGNWILRTLQYTTTSNSISMGATVNIGTDIARYGSNGGIKAMLNQRKAIFVFQQGTGGSGNIIARSADISASNPGTITLIGSNTIIEGGGHNYVIAAAQSSSANDGKVLVVARDETDSNKGKSKSFTMNSSGAFTVNNDLITFNNEDTRHLAIIADPDTDQFIVSNYTVTNNGLQSRVYKEESANMSANDFLGFATGAISDTASGAIAVTGNTTTQSSLTPGQQYYVQKNGTLATTADTPSVVAGLALSSTKLLIRK